jgi:hypothetical protein
LRGRACGFIHCCVQAELNKPDADFTTALDIYNNARIAKRPDGTPRTM